MAPESENFIRSTVTSRSVRSPFTSRYLSDLVREFEVLTTRMLGEAAEVELALVQTAGPIGYAGG